jgi:hypothetical protein
LALKGLNKRMTAHNIKARVNAEEYIEIHHLFIQKPRLNYYKQIQLIMTDELIIYSFTSLPRIFHLYGDVTGLQNSGLFSALIIFEHRDRSLSCHTYCDTGPGFFRSYPKDRPHSVASYTKQGLLWAYLNLDHLEVYLLIKEQQI